MRETLASAMLQPSVASLPSAVSNTAERLAYTIPEATAASGIGRTTLYQLIGDGDLVAIKIGNRTLITAESLRKLIEAAPRAEIRPAHRRTVRQ